MTLMSRIKVKDFLSFTNLDKIQLIERVQALRIHSLEEARTKKAKGRTKSATRNLAKRGRRVADPTKALAKVLNKLTPSQLEKLKEIYG